MARMHALVMVGLAVGVVAVLPSVAGAQDDGGPRGGSGVLTANGRIGALHTGDRLASVRRTLGRPSRTVVGEGEGGVRLVELRYACGSDCRSSYFFDERRRLRNFFTSSDSFRTQAGTTIGDDLALAESNEGATSKPPLCGGDPDDRVITRRGKAELYVTMTGGEVSVLAVAGRGSVLGC